MNKVPDSPGSILATRCPNCESPIFFSWDRRERLCCLGCSSLFKVTKGLVIATVVSVLNSTIICGGCGTSLEVNPTNSYFNCPICGRLYYNSKSMLARKIVRRKVMVEAMVNAKIKV